MRAAILVSCAAAMTAAAAPLGAASAIAQPSVFEAIDHFSLRRASDVQISPDGRRIAYVLQATNITTDGTDHTIWIVDVATGVQAQLVDGPASNPRWSPNGRLAYTAKGRAGRPALFIHRFDDPHRTVGPLAEDAELIAWSPDGAYIAYSKFVPGADAKLGGPPPKPPGASWAPPLKVTISARWQADGSGDLPVGHSHLFVVAVDDGRSRQLTQGGFDEVGPFSWTPDGREILFSSARTEARERTSFAQDLFSLRLADGLQRQLTRTADYNSVPTVSPGGRLVAFVTIDAGRNGYAPSNVAVMRPDGSDVRVISRALDRDVQAVGWDRNSRGLFVTYVDQGRSKVGRMGLSGIVRDLTDRVGGDESVTVSKNGNVAFPLGSPDRPPEVGMVAHGALRVLTRLNDELLGSKTLATLRRVVVPSSVDGARIDVWLTLPPQYDPHRRYPLILAIHGGPYGFDLPYWSSSQQLYAAAGYVVANANYRGSTSYGIAFSQPIDRAFPAVADEDLLNVVDGLIAQKIADPERLFVTGGSAGGEMATWLVGKTNRFRAAVASKPITNQVSAALSSDQYRGAGAFSFGVPPWVDQDDYWKRSPLSLVGNVTTPTMLIVGEEDRRTPLNEAIQFYAALQVRGIPTALVRVPEAGHASLGARPSQFTAQISATLAWFARFDVAKAAKHLAGGCTCPPGGKRAARDLLGRGACSGP